MLVLQVHNYYADQGWPLLSVASQAGERASEGKQRSSVPSTSMPSLVCPPRNELIACLHSTSRAKLVLGDINESTVQSVAAGIKRVGGWVDYIDCGILGSQL